jgi:hypothetical protein
MIDEEMKELDKLKTLLFATLDYLLEHYVGSMVFDQWDPSVDHYLQEKQKTEKDYKDANLERLQQRLNNWIRYLQDRMDLNFESYIKDQTGYEIDIFKQLPQNVVAIVSKGKIEDDEELKSTNSMMVKYAIVQVVPPPPGSKSNVVEETSTKSKQITEEEFARLQRDNGLIFEQQSPDYQWNRILLRTYGIEEYAATEVTIVLKGGSGCIYCAKGSSLPIKAYWKDNSTVVIETKEEYTTEIKHSTVSSYEDLIKIVYIFN